MLASSLKDTLSCVEQPVESKKLLPVPCLLCVFTPFAGESHPMDRGARKGKSRAKGRGYPVQDRPFHTWI